MQDLESDPYVTVVGPDVVSVITAALGPDAGVRGPDASGEYSARCPVPEHDDKVQSLRFRASIDGRALIHCHSGVCDFDAIVEAMGLEKWQLAPIRVEWDYHRPDGTYVFSVVRMHGADGSKTIRQGVRGGSPEGDWLWSVSGVDTHFLFRADLLQAGDERGPVEELLIPEGEKDAAILDAVLIETKARGRYATATPGGAGADVSAWIGAAVTATGTRSVTILCDRDSNKAGERRGRVLARWLAESAPDVAVRVLVPADREGVGKDLAEIVDRHGPRAWRDHYDQLAVDPAADSLAEYDGTAVAGSITTVGGEDGLGRDRMAIVRNESAVPVITGVFEPLSVRLRGDRRVYELQVTPSLADAGERVVDVSADDLSSGQAFAKWLAGVPDVGRVPLCGIAPSEIAECLRLYFDYRVRVTGAPVRIEPAATGWVCADTGVVADRAEAGAELVFVGAEGEVVAGDPDGHAYSAPRVRGGRWGAKGDEVEAAWAVWQALTFADSPVTAPVAGWAAATVLSPFLGMAGAGLRPGLAVVAKSGSGKTNGAAALLMGLIGCPGHQAGTGAAMRRKLEGGVGTVVWFDDTAIIETEAVKEWLRVAITRSEFTLSDVDGGSNATVTGALTAVPAISTEGLGWTNETAMRDRFVIVSPNNPQGRTSWRVGREGQPQWDDVVSLNWALGGDPTTRAAWVVKGLYRTLAARGGGDPEKGAREALSSLGGTGVRAAWAQGVVRVGAEVLFEWLESVRRAAGDSWPGAADRKWAQELTWARRALAEWVAAGAASVDTAEAACSLVDEVVPRLMQAHTSTVRVGGASEFAATDLALTDLETARAAVRRIVDVGDGEVERGLPAVLVDTDGRYWVRTASCAAAYVRLVRTAEERTTGAQALIDQLNSDGVIDNPDWAIFNRSGRGSGSGLEVRVGKGGSRVKAVYHRLSEAAAGRIEAASIR